MYNIHCHFIQVIKYPLVLLLPTEPGEQQVSSSLFAQFALRSSVVICTATHCHCQVGLMGLIEVTSKWRADLATLLSGSLKMAVLQVTLSKNCNWKRIKQQKYCELVQCYVAFGMFLASAP